MANPVVVGDGLYVAGVTSAEEARIVQAAGWARSGAAGSVVARTGVVWAGSSTLLVGTATVGPPMTVLVKAHHFIASKASGEGIYLGAVATDQLVDVAAAPATNSRIDVVYSKQEDTGSATSPDAQTRAIVGVVTGTPAGSPTPPAIPAGAVEIGQLRVYAGATKTTDGTVTITTTARWTAPLGSPVPVRNQTERDALTAFTGLRAWRLDTHTLDVHNGTTWVSETPKRLYVQGWGPQSYSNLGAIGTLALPALPVASRVHITAIGMVGFSESSGQNFGLNITASAGTMTSGQSNQQTRAETPAQWYSYAWLGYLDVPASTAVTITTTFSTPGAAGWWRGNLHCQIYLAGEY